MKRSADCEWRWLGAISPGRMSCSPAYRLCVMHDSPRMPGFSRISTRRTASRAVMALPDSMRYGRASRYFHSAGFAGVAGSLGIRLCRTSQSGARLCLSMRRYRSCRPVFGFGTLAIGNHYKVCRVKDGFAFSVVRGVLRLLLAVFYRRIEVVGVERIPASGGLIVAANHHNSIVDAMILLAVMPRRLS